MAASVFALQKGGNVKDVYMIYVEKYGKIQSGGRLEAMDYGEMEADGFVEYNEEGKLAVTLASQDVKMGEPIRPRTNFVEQIKRLKA